MKNTLETRLGIFFALAALTGIILLEIAGDTSVFRKAFRIHALFGSVQELKKGDPVKMAGVQVGVVEDIQIQGSRVSVRLNLDRHHAPHIRTDSKAMVKFLGLMGQNYVAISFGSPSSPPVAEGAVLETEEQTDLSTLMARLDGVASGVENLARSMSGDQFANLLGPFTDFLKENSPKLTAILGNLHNISAQIAQGEGTVGKLISDDALYVSALAAVTNLNHTSEEIGAAVQEARTLLGQVGEGTGTLGKLTRDETLYTEAVTAVVNLREIMQKINQGQGTVGKLVNDDSLFRNARLTLQKLDKAAEGLEDQGPITLIGIAVNQLF
jgi:phospholipid/cholesterol/gamma-HCH transport system substrate-binding protein